MGDAGEFSVSSQRAVLSRLKPIMKQLEGGFDSQFNKMLRD